MVPKFMNMRQRKRTLQTISIVVFVPSAHHLLLVKKISPETHPLVFKNQIPMTSDLTNFVSAIHGFSHGMALCQSRENCWLTSLTSGDWNMQYSSKQPLFMPKLERELLWSHVHYKVWSTSHSGERPVDFCISLGCMHTWLLA